MQQKTRWAFLVCREIDGRPGQKFEFMAWALRCVAAQFRRKFIPPPSSETSIFSPGPVLENQEGPFFTCASGFFAFLSQWQKRS